MAEDTIYPRFKAAVVQASPKFLNRNETIARVDKMSAEAAREGADLAVFGESFIPGFPIWNAVLPPVNQHGLFRRLLDNAIEVPSESSTALGEIARRHGIFLSVGVTERCRLRPATLWNSNLIFAPSGKLIVRHRKLVATWAEKLSWASGDANGLRVLDTRLGRLGMLICGENFNTLARFTLLALGEQVHLSTYPPIWPVDPLQTETSQQESGSSGYSLSDAIRIRAAAHSIEGKVFNLVSATALDDEAVEIASQGDDDVAQLLWSTPRGCSMIIHPSGRVLAEIDSGEGIITAEIATEEALALQELHDIAGHYNRFDIFRLSVDFRANESLSTRTTGEDATSAVLAENVGDSIEVVE